MELNTLDSAYIGDILYYRMNFEIKIEFGATKGILVFSSWIDGRQVGTASISFAK